MDNLEVLIYSKKKEISDKLGKKSWISRGELRKIEEEELLKKQKEINAKRKSSGDIEDETSIEVKERKKDNEYLDILDEYNKTTKTIPNKFDVIYHLRLLNEPATLFGESDEARYSRLRKAELRGQANIELKIGQQNTYLEGLGTRIPLYSVDNDKEEEISIVSEDIKQENNESKGEFVLRWISIQLEELKKQLKSRSIEEAESNKGKQESAQYYQTERDLKPLIRLLRSESQMDKEVLDKLYEIVQCCCSREYIKAHDKYIELAIGNAPWPMGVTMVGIHERASRTKIFSSHIAHVLNDETTRKYIQMFKRLITHCQRQRPTDPSKMVLIAKFEHKLNK
ncbi:pre-mRNA-splicing factor 18 [Cryptosporidium andersoni]|uniref:Pre-mRNA-splicing factor 18 n=1 Tax=Cryptosporidium andersoni TaxID=117008 RepID=A0A1J4MT78_9CRYT|nr:pre-mRNA-splicing factor 18 [Cryptosporidium andersoni]